MSRPELRVARNEPISLPTGASFLYARDVPQAAFKAVRETSLKLLTTHVVDKGKPLAEPVEQQRTPHGLARRATAREACASARGRAG